MEIENLEVLALTKVDPTLREAEAALYGRRWFDFRHLHPVEATRQFGAAYAAVVTESYRETKDLKTAEQVCSKINVDPMDSPFITAYWRARQGMDAISVPYDFGIRVAFKKTLSSGWKVFPRPNQLYGRELLMDILDAWKERCKATLQLSTIDRYRVEHYTGHPDQEAHQQWVIAQIRARGNPAFPLSRALQERLLPEITAEKEFGAAVVRSAFALARSVSTEL